MIWLSPTPNILHLPSTRSCWMLRSTRRSAGSLAVGSLITEIAESQKGVVGFPVLPASLPWGGRPRAGHDCPHFQNARVGHSSPRVISSAFRVSREDLMWGSRRYLKQCACPGLSGCAECAFRSCHLRGPKASVEFYAVLSNTSALAEVGVTSNVSVQISGSGGPV